MPCLRPPLWVPALFFFFHSVINLVLQHFTACLIKMFERSALGTFTGTDLKETYTFFGETVY